MKKEDYKIKMAVIAGASHALDYKDKHIRATSEEILQNITDEIDEILKHIENEEEF